MPPSKQGFEAKVEADISRFGYHLTVVQQSLVPRYAYTIGMSCQGLPELMLAGATSALLPDVRALMASAVNAMCEGDRRVVTSAPGLPLREVNHVWAGAMMLGANRQFGAEGYSAMQIIPEAHRSLDVPDLTQSDISADPVWRWLVVPWPFSVPAASIAVTNLPVLFGSRVTEVLRCRTDRWEAFAGAGPGTAENDMRAISLATLLGIDPSVRPILELDIGSALWRKPTDTAWTPWRRTSN